MPKDLKNNEHGVVFVTVLIVIITTMVLAISVLSLNISQIKSAENELKYIQAKVLADGALFKILSTQFVGTPQTTDSYPETVGSTTFTIQSDITACGTCPVGSNSVPLDITVTF